MKASHPSPGRIYMLPKIHKPGSPDSPIISGTGISTKPFSASIDAPIRDIPSRPPHFIRHQSISSGTLASLLSKQFLSCHIGCLLTSYEHSSRRWHCCPCKSIRMSGLKNLPKSHIVSVLERFVLELNSFEINDHHFLQISGTAMGT